jgi:hypothetical protein
MLELVIPFKEYLISREDYHRIKEHRQSLFAKVKKLDERNKPADQLKE